MTDFEQVLRIEGGRVLATLIRFTGDIGIAEDALHDAVIVALQRWPVAGAPDNPAAWLTTAARNKALDRMRRESKRSGAERSAVALNGADFDDDASMVSDDQLRLLFTCCHPALSPEARVALALRTICRLSTVEIARVHMVSETTMGQRISRAKKKIAVAKIPYRIPHDHELPDRLPTVLTTIYAVFTAGHHAAVGELGGRVDLAAEGVRLSRLMAQLMPDEPECFGLLALTLATHARRDSRVDSDGELVLMEDQNRSLWRHNEIAEAARLVENALPKRRIGPYQIQAAISCLHGLAPASEQTDWRQIAELYAMLASLQPSPAVLVNQAVAIAFADGPAAGLSALARIDHGAVTRWHLYWSTQAELLLRSGNATAATSSFDRALACDMNDTDRRFLERRRLSVLV